MCVCVCLRETIVYAGKKKKIGVCVSFLCMCVRDLVFEYVRAVPSFDGYARDPV